MRRLVVGMALVLSVIAVVGSLKAERLKIQTRQEKTVFTVTVTLKAVTEQHRWLSVRACSAVLNENNHAECDYYWERESTQEIRLDQRQYPFEWRGLPGGTTLITAMAFDNNSRILDSGSLTVFRGR